VSGKERRVIGELNAIKYALFGLYLIFF